MHGTVQLGGKGAGHCRAPTPRVRGPEARASGFRTRFRGREVHGTKRPGPVVVMTTGANPRNWFPRTGQDWAVVSGIPLRHSASPFGRRGRLQSRAMGRAAVEGAHHPLQILLRAEAAGGAVDGLPAAEAGNQRNGAQKNSLNHESISFGPKDLSNTPWCTLASPSNGRCTLPTFFLCSEQYPT